jgi:hypothetical protein
MTGDDLRAGHPIPDPLVAFLLARLDEDEEAARRLLLGGEFLPFESLGRSAGHGARHGPLRVLREVAAKRAVVQAWRESARRDRNPADAPGAAVALIAALAAVFAEHPDFDPAWLGVLEEPGDRAEPPDNVVQLPLRE